MLSHTGPGGIKPLGRIVTAFMLGSYPPFFALIEGRTLLVPRRPDMGEFRTRGGEKWLSSCCTIRTGLVYGVLVGVFYTAFT